MKSIDKFTCDNCGHEWLQGQNGNHDCKGNLLKIIANLKSDNSINKMKKVLINKSQLPMSMTLSANLSRTASAPFSNTPPAAPTQYSPQPLMNEMLDVLFENQELLVGKSVLSANVYTIDKLGFNTPTLIEPDDEALIVYHHLQLLNVGNESLNQYHYDTLASLFNRDLLTFIDEEFV